MSKNREYTNAEVLAIYSHLNNYRGSDIDNDPLILVLFNRSECKKTVDIMEELIKPGEEYAKYEQLKYQIQTKYCETENGNIVGYDPKTGKRLDAPQKNATAKVIEGNEDKLNAEIKKLNSEHQNAIAKRLDGLNKYNESLGKKSIAQPKFKTIKYKSLPKLPKEIAFETMESLIELGIIVVK